MPSISYGIEGRLAPDFGIDTWFNLPEGKSRVELADHADQCVYLYCFQSWCPGCHSLGFPAMLRMMELFADEPKLAFLTVQTVFEGFGTNTLDAAREVARKYELDIPVGHDPGPESSGSVLMPRYRTGGTPWTIVIDRDRRVRFNGFQADVAMLAEGIRMLCR